MSMTNETNLIEIIKAFPDFGKYIGYKPVSEGHINDTYIVEYEMEDGSVSRYLLQRINVNVFKKPVELMENSYYNKAAAEYAKHGFKLTYHNHSFEFVEVKDGKSMMDLLVEGLDKDNVSFVLDTCWVANAGGDVCAWLEKLADRIDILHLKDLKVTFSDEGRWAVRQQLCEVGNGNLAWDRILRTAEATGVKHIVVEQDNSWIDGDPFKSLEFSKKYLDQYLG